jgi:hypothetical protein
MLMLLLACSTWPEEPPPKPTALNRFDTAVDGGPSVFVAASGDGGGRPPIIQGARLNKPTAKKAATLTVSAKDPEGGRVSTKIDWYVNDVRVSGENGASLSNSYFKKGDLISARIEASDGQNTSERKVDPIQVGNTAPSFVTKRSDFRTIDGFQVKAKDPDNDPLTYRLEDPPPGMSINSEGVLRYSGGAGVGSGTYKTKIIVEDPDGEAIVWPLDVNVSAGSGG